MMKRMQAFGDKEDEKLTLYHGSDIILKQPLYNYGRENNDYGVGFYTTMIYSRAVSWALNMGDSEHAYVNKYALNTTGLRIINLDDFGVFAWIAEIASHRKINAELSAEFLPEFIAKYKIDTSDADVLIGYRADDNYSDVIAAFIDGLINHEEVQRLFYKGNLGEQYFIKSEKAFEHLKFLEAVSALNYTELADTSSEIQARMEVSKFLNQRRLSIAKRFTVPEITIIDANINNYRYNREFKYYERV